MSKLHPPEKIYHSQTVGQALQWAVDYLQEKGVEQPRLDAEVLLAHILGLERTGLYLQLNQPLSPSLFYSFCQKIYRRSKHEPVAYIVGKKEFWSLDFAVGQGVLIPRPETEFLIEEAQKIAQRIQKGALRILDIGTGSGNIAICLAKELSLCQIFALDISFKALYWAKYNIQTHQVEQRIKLLAGDLFHPLNRQRAWFHIIISNPPYVPAEEWDALPSDIREYEPRMALDGGKRGTRLLRQIIHQAPDYLFAGGYLLLEFGDRQLNNIQSLVEERSGLTLVRIVHDYSHIPRIAVIKKES
jgi:release factor glutamine methyltransferase